MSSDFEAYEQDFGTITAEVTNKIGRIPKLSGDEKTQLVLNVDKQLEEVRELLEQMDLEAREIPIQSRAMYNSRLKSYKQEIEKLEKDFTGPESTPGNPAISSRKTTYQTGIPEVHP
ncbi:vesicle transport through interaction with t-SNAREs homolog 1A [Cebidichthys violaceus]|uniref:vesicle transport through interaction with t-SNAREs homolog 1A n=1 Tax=Cebidichthys violaceus TaxID=271503 RepID=UPI0035CAA339